MKPQNSRREIGDFVFLFPTFQETREQERVLIETQFELISHWQSFLKLHGKVSS